MGRECELCGRPAERQFTEVVGGERQTMPICLACAEKLGVAGSQPPAGPDIAPQIKITAEITQTIRPAGMPTAPRRCGTCGMTLVSVRKSGRVGCPDCYQAFREHLEPLLRRVHGALEHQGLAHRGRKPVDDRGAELARLRGALERAVADEDFEGAARIRDQIDRFHRGKSEGGRRE